MHILAPYAPQHTEPLRHLYLQVRRTAFTWQDSSQFTLTDFDHVIKGEEVLVALHQRVPIGFIAWWPPGDFIHSLFIAPAWQGKGVGRELLHACLARMGRPATLKCLTSNQPALRFYNAQGWVVAATGEGADGTYYLLSFTENPY